jgi:hypothetical protein
MNIPTGPICTTRKRNISKPFSDRQLKTGCLNSYEYCIESIEDNAKFASGRQPPSYPPDTRTRRTFYTRYPRCQATATPTATGVKTYYARDQRHWIHLLAGAVCGVSKLRRAGDDRRDLFRCLTGSNSSRVPSLSTLCPSFVPIPGMRICFRVVRYNTYHMARYLCAKQQP